jgi:histidinol dehydrogenase
MRVLPLTEAVARRWLERRRRSDTVADRAARRIVADVRRRGDVALAAWTRRLDGPEAARARLRVTLPEMARAERETGAVFRRSLERAARNIRRVARRQLPRAWTLRVEPGVRVGQIVRPLGAVGCYVPGGRYPLVSSLLMTVLPAQVAGVRRIVVACPKPSGELLAAARRLGVSEVLRIGGAQAIGALAYGTQTIAPVEKIVGPGNRWVAAAKRLVGADVAVDMVAGPTEVLVLATRGNARFIAADLVAQAEHDPDAVALLVTPSPRLAEAVAAEVEKQLGDLPKTNPAWKSLRLASAILVAPSLDAAIRFANRVAPEHLSVPDAKTKLVDKLSEAGSVFLGPWSAQPIGDYASGTNHVLPTSGWARARGGLSVADFVKCSSTQEISRSGLKRLAPVVTAMARAEGLEAHARAVEVRR